MKAIIASIFLTVSPAAFSMSLNEAKGEAIEPTNENEIFVRVCHRSQDWICTEVLANMNLKNKRVEKDEVTLIFFEDSMKFNTNWVRGVAKFKGMEMPLTESCYAPVSMKSSESSTFVGSNCFIEYKTARAI